MADGRIIFDTRIDNSHLASDFKKTEEQIKKAQSKIEQLEGAKASTEEDAAETKASIDAQIESIAKLKTKLEELRSKKASELSAGGYVRNKQDIAYTEAELSAQQADLQSLQERWSNLTAQTNQYENDIKGARTQIDVLNSQAGELRARMTQASGAAKNFSAQFSAAIKKVGARIKGIIASALLFSVVYKAIQGIVEYSKKALSTNTEFTNQLSRTKAALLTAFQPLYNLILPVAQSILYVVEMLANAITNIASKLTGKSIREYAKDAEKLSDAVNDSADAAKNAKKSFASFDEINQLGSSDDSAASTVPDFSAYDSSDMEANIAKITAIASAALLAIGCILFFSGHYIKGTALIAIGVGALAGTIAGNWDTYKSMLEGDIGWIVALVSTALLALGIILLVYGGIKTVGLAIGLIAAGAIGLASAIAANWDAIIEALQGNIGKIIAIVSGALLVIGIILVFTFVAVPLGLALIAAGAAGLVAVAAANWDTLPEKLQGKLGAILAIVGGVLLVIGLILAFSGIALPLGIALIAAGAAALVTVVAANWDTLPEKLQGPLGKILAIAGSALLVLGIILCCFGIIPLGIALIAAGAGSLVAVIAANWNGIVEKIKEVWQKIKDWWNQKVKPIFTVEWWKNKFKVISEALKTKIKDGINTAIELLNKFIGWINKKMHFEWDAVTIAGKQIVPAGNIQLFRLPPIPYLAQGAVIPPNKEFMAVLGDQKSGTNIEAPLSTIKQAVAEVLNEMGAIGGQNETVLEIDGEKFGRIVYRLNRKESNRIGVKLSEA